MNKKNIAKSLQRRLDKWVESIDSEEIRKTIKEDAIVTGGALVSLLNDEEPNDLDIYFKTLEACVDVARYYANIWNLSHENKVSIVTEGQRVECYIKSLGALIEEGETAIDDNTEVLNVLEEEKATDVGKPKYRPRYFSTNAISLSDKIQIVIRFWGSVETIHENYDFVHCTCSYDYKEDKVNTPNDALISIINKELVYKGSKYPLCSIIRTRKFISRGWTINAGQYVKMALQLNELDLKDINVFKDQLCGVDSAYFNILIESLIQHKEKHPEFQIDSTYVIKLIDRIF